MHQAITVREKDQNPVGNLLFMATGVLLLLGAALFISIYQPEWLNFLWLSVATISSIAVAGWVIGHMLDSLLDDFG